MIFSNSFSRYNFINLKKKNGITLIALVVTIVVLLILAGITITMLFGENGIIKKAQDATDATKNDQDTISNGLHNIEHQMGEALGEVQIPEGLDIGSFVSYSPSGTYTWQSAYYSSTKTEITDNVNLSSAEGQDFNISKWKVLSLDNISGDIVLIADSPTIGKVCLEEAQGYNNGVKLLNDACNNLYGNTSKGIFARSINIEDIEYYMKKDKLEEVHDPAFYEKQVTHDYLTSNSKYPVIYDQEKQSTFYYGDLGLSDSPENFIERSEGSIYSEVPGSITSMRNLQPYQTYWNKDATYMSEAFRDYTKKDSTTNNYYSLIMPGINPTYWVASRCINAGTYNCTFYIRFVDSGQMEANDMYCSNDLTYSGLNALFPVITLNSKLIQGDTASGFSIKK